MLKTRDQLNKRLVYLDSINRTSGTIEDSIFDIHPQIEHVVGYEILDFDIGKNPFYNITAKCNSFSWDDTGTNSIVSTIPIKSYTPIQFAQQIQDTMNADAIAADSYAVVFDAQTGKYTITEDSDTFVLTTTVTLNSLYTKLGFNTNAVQVGATSYETDNVGDLNDLYFIFLKSRAITNILTDAPRNVGCLANSIHRVKIDVPFAGDINKNDIQFPTFINCNSHQLSTIDIQIVDNDGDEVDMNGVEWSMTIMLYYEHKHLNLRQLRG